MNRLAAWMAIAFGVVLTVGETYRNWGDWQWWPYWFVDFIGAALLIGGGVLTLRGAVGGKVLLSGAWGFSCAMFYMSFWSHVDHIDESIVGNIDHTPLTVIIGVMWVVTILGFVLACCPAKLGDESPS